jgi:dipeptide transport system ATP-binding protein
MALLEIEDLSVDFPSTRGVLHAVDGLSLSVQAGEVLAIVGESGSGKSVAMMAVMGLLAFPGQLRARGLRFAGQDLLRMNPVQRRRTIGKDVAMIFQDPTTSLNPCFTVGFQLAETLKLHLGLDRAGAKRRCVELLEQVGIAAPETRLAAYPHQLSGGMSQRVMIAMAVACNPQLLIADEPTTALDVTVQAQILDLLKGLQKERGMALVLITHNMGVVSEMAQRVAVMYAGQIVEQRSASDLFRAPLHPYTEALLRAMPQHSDGQTRLATIAGMVPGIHDRPPACLFAPRCSHVASECNTRAPQWGQPVPGVRCHTPLTDGAPA